MTRQQAELYVSAYNALLTISTKGEDTLTMANVLNTMRQLLNEIEIYEKPTPMEIAEEE